MARKRKQGGRASSATMPVMRPDAAGIDVGATEIFVAVPADRATENIRSFPTFTQDLYMLADWLHACGIKTVAILDPGVKHDPDSDYAVFDEGLAQGYFVRDRGGQLTHRARHLVEPQDTRTAIEIDPRYGPRFGSLRDHPHAPRVPGNRDSLARTR